MGGHPPGERQSVGQLIKHLRLLTPPVSGCITGPQLPLLRAAPTERGGGGGTWTAMWLTALIICFRPGKASVQPSWNTGRRQTSHLDSSALVFKLSQWDQKCPKPKRTECDSRQRLGACPDPPSHSSPLSLTFPQPDLLCFDLIRKKETCADKTEAAADPQVYAQVGTDKHKSINAPLRCIPEWP